MIRIRLINQRFPSDPRPTRTKRSPAGNDRRAYDGMLEKWGRETDSV